MRVSLWKEESGELFLVEEVDGGLTGPPLVFKHRSRETSTFAVVPSDWTKGQVEKLLGLEAEDSDDD